MALGRAVVATLALLTLAGSALAAEGDDFDGAARPLADGGSGTSITLTNKGTTTLRCARVQLQRGITGHSSPDGKTWQAGAPGELRIGELGLAPGQSTTLEVRTAEPVAAGEAVEGSVSSDCESDVTKVFAQSAPAPATAADLNVTISRFDPTESSWLEALQNKLGSVFMARVTVTNHGPDPANDVLLTIAVHKMPRVHREQGGRPVLWSIKEERDAVYDFVNGKPVFFGFGPPRSEVVPIADGCEDSTGDSFLCRVGTLAPEESRHYVLPFFIVAAGRLELSSAGTSSTHDPGPRTNRAAMDIEIPGVPDSGAPGCRGGSGGRAAAAACDLRPRIVPAGRAPTFRGTARDAKAVDVAILRLRRGARVAAARQPVCEWLVDTRARFAPGHTDGRECLRPRAMLRARGAKAWELRLRRPLPKGRYLMFTRAVGPSGAFEASFSPRDGNRLVLVVR